MNYILHIFILVGLFSLLASALNLLAGYTGLLSLCQASFYGLGAYVSAILLLRGWNWIEATIMSILISGLVGAAVGSVLLRYRGDYFVIATFSFQIVVTNLMLNWTELTRGPLGIVGIPRPRLLNWTVSSNADFFVLVIVIAAATFTMLSLLLRSPYGRTLRAIREDEVFVQSVGKNVAYHRVSVFVISSAIGAIAGSVYAVYVTYIDPSTFRLQESIFILSIVIIGGAGNIWGSVLGATLLVTLPEALRFVGFPPTVAANLRQVLFGVVLVTCMLWRPTGLVGEYIFEGRSRDVS